MAELAVEGSNRPNSFPSRNSTRGDMTLISPPLVKYLPNFGPLVYEELDIETAKVLLPESSQCNNFAPLSVL